MVSILNQRTGNNGQPITDWIGTSQDTIPDSHNGDTFFMMDLGTKYVYSEEGQDWYEDVRGKGGSQPSGSIDITENGTVDVSQYATANVNVSSPLNIAFIKPSSAKKLVVPATGIKELYFSGLGKTSTSSSTTENKYCKVEDVKLAGSAQYRTTTTASASWYNISYSSSESDGKTTFTFANELVVASTYNDYMVVWR